MATYDSMLEEFRSLIYKDGWGVKRGEFPAPKDAKYIRDLARVGAFLNPENELFCEALELLDTAMIDLFNLRTGASFRKNKIKLNSFSTFEHGRKLEVACKENGLDATKHLLASVLAEMEIKEGFQGISEAGKCVSFYNNLGDDEFGGAIKSMHLAKDYVGSDHGAFTHRIQWYCASVVKRKLELENAKTSSTFKSSGLVWGLVFDRNAREGVIVEPNDFRRPELMNPWIANNPRYGNHSWPVLSSFLKSRLERMSGRGWSSDVLKINIASKIYPDKAKPSLGYRKASAVENEKELRGFNLSSEEMVVVEKAATGSSFDAAMIPKPGFVSFKGGIKVSI